MHGQNPTQCSIAADSTQHRTGNQSYACPMRVTPCNTNLQAVCFPDPALTYKCQHMRPAHVCTPQGHGARSLVNTHMLNPLSSTCLIYPHVLTTTISSQLLDIPAGCCAALLPCTLPPNSAYAAPARDISTNSGVNISSRT
jgi:hypothetical protein